MKANLLTLTYGFLAVAGAFRVPDNATEGLYEITLAEDGSEIHTLFGVLDEPVSAGAAGDRVNPKHLEARAVPWPSGTAAICKNPEAYLSHADFYDHAYNAFLTNCANTGGVNIQIKKAVYAYYGSAVAYMCNYSGSGNRCNGNEWGEAVGRVRDACGKTQNGQVQAGWLSVPGWKKSYGFGRSSEDFC